MMSRAARTADDPGQRPVEPTLRECAKSILTGLLISVPMLGWGGYVVYSNWLAQERERITQVEMRLAHTRLVSAPPKPTLPVSNAAHGRDLFLSTCAACHGAEGKGVAGLGRDLSTSWFVASLKDTDLHAFLVHGRPNGQPVAMPPRGGNPDLQDSDLRDIVTFLRGIQDPRRLPELPPPTIVTKPLTEEEKAKALAAAGGDAELAEYIASGQKLYASTCIACHGPGGVGVAGNGKPLTVSEFVRKTNDDDLLAFIKKGRDPGDPANTTGVGMPAKGGNPALSDDDILDVIAYLRSLQSSAAPSSAQK